MNEAPVSTAITNRLMTSRTVIGTALSSLSTSLTCGSRAWSGPKVTAWRDLWPYGDFGNPTFKRT
ncbi:hypothetical protein Pka01_12820 [Planotetraspora kaengkrachanensis]|uniref:Uncharacterized protein n=1 Tax=Planotetraspora kaengkrachanensis TaxID=575193 RepID=A0A8J3LWS0_9ACTN|nr:hypothetical protein Pka01_12820 [Planotetraspora kaengkrachanensis]